MSNIRDVSTASLLVLAAAFFVACDDGLTSPENLAELAVTLEITGTPGEGGFVVEWSDTDSQLGGRAPVNPDVLPKTFHQVPLGETRVELWDAPENCSADDTVKTVEVVRSEVRQVVFTITCG